MGDVAKTKTRSTLNRAAREIATLAESVLGSRAAALQWLAAPALGLDGQRPIDLLDTPLGVEAVRVYLVRIDHGVYT
ncbi:MbcA/ParS/Xre antitoxin family protein [Variovorax sp. Sphag1AA]|uniref:MbcA/ParS/Xre antitoxin family protein n=1 Tax=Variovorax sp. Sphag1AA TaxID=2587027 RepID=UPI001614CF11|nr:MbcA/ParS/Xre antitoxin family protein [Variovorax sp. Sphag1AA]MBB3176345.1 putative toxin-antitoxin system antitoxin component (TIGR02293 family) [Variovorax sp. Sphag1AA]